jgi:carbon-monoxide dehydrogenase medium subunit
MIGDPHVRHRGTIGGSISNNDPAADYPAAMLALGATIVTNKRNPADKFFKGLFETALKDGELVTAVSFTAPAKAGYAKFPNPASRYAMVGVFVAKGKDGVRAAVTGAGDDGVFRSKEDRSRSFQEVRGGCAERRQGPGWQSNDRHACRR